MGEGLDVAGKARRALRVAAKRSLRVPVIQRLYYSVRNAGEFEDLVWHEVMLADEVRMSTYARAIDELVPEGSVVVDVGTGTGVLACMAARRASKVYAVEHSSLIERAEHLAAANGITNVEFVPSHSADFSPAEKVDVLLHEQIGMNLVDEDMTTNLGDLRRRILKPGGTILPGRFEMRVVPVSLQADQRLPYVYEQRVHGLDFSSFEQLYRPEDAARWDRRRLDPRIVDRMLAPPVVLFTLDLSTEAGSELTTDSSGAFEVADDGVLDGYLVSFKVEFSPTIGFETGPLSPTTHWLSYLYRTEQTTVSRGDHLDFSLSITIPTDATTWTWTHAHRSA